MRITDAELNRLKLLQALRRREPISRTELTEITGLASATITELTGDLLARGLLREEKPKDRAFGRPRMQLLINADAGYAVGAYTTMNSIAVELVDLKGAQIFAQQTPLPDIPTLGALAGHIAAVVDKAIRNSEVERCKIRRVGVALSGLIDSERGVVHWVHSLPRGPVPVATLIEERLGLPVNVDNDADVTARGEHWFGSQLDNFSLVTLGLGLGFARYVDGMLKTGANGFNPEMSHVKVILEGGRRCYCGGTGCLAAHATIWGIVGQVCEAREEPFPALSELEAVFEKFAEDADAGDSLTRSVLDAAGAMFGTAVANHINITDPGAVLIRFLNPRLAKALSPAIRVAVERGTLPTLHSRTQLEIAIGQDQFAAGTAALVLEQIYRLS